MHRLTANDIANLFESVAALFDEKKDELCSMDAAMGDGDLGLTMSKGYGALPSFLRENVGAGDIGMQLGKSAMKMQNLVPSTMGTLMSSGILEAGKALRGKTELMPEDLVVFAEAFAVGIKKRGKCELGDRTLLDAVDAAAKAARELIKTSPDPSFLDVSAAAAHGAAEGAEATKAMEPKFGKAVVHAAKAKGVPDQGAVAGYYLYEGIANYFAN